MKIKARLEYRPPGHEVTVETNGSGRPVELPAKADGRGLAVNGGEMLCTALAICYCNDIYREAARFGIEVRGVDVEVEAEFGGAGEPAHRISYSVKVDANAADDDIRALILHIDTVAEVHNTLRSGVEVKLLER
jgi:uncharacterized OsmC-like protein